MYYHALHQYSWEYIVIACELSRDALYIIYIIFYKW